MLEDSYRLERIKLSSLRLEHDADLEHPVFGEGNASHPLIMFIGEAPGREEAACGSPFVGKAGRQLDEMLQTAGIDRGEVFVTNAVKYRPYKLKNGRASNRTPTPVEIYAGMSLLRDEISSVNPTVIATLGNVPLFSVMTLAETDGKPFTVGQAHGSPFKVKIGTFIRRVYPLYHPAASIYNRELKPVLQQDLINLGEYARRSFELDKEILYY